MDEPFNVVARFTPVASKRSGLQSLLEGILDVNRSQPGCLRFDLYEAPDDGDFVLQERFASKAAFEHHRTTDHYRDYRARLGPLIACPVSVTILKPINEAE